MNHRRREPISHAIRAEIARAAQVVYDAWDQDAEGVDEEYGVGGICDDVADAIVDVLDHAGIEAVSRHDDSSNHTAAYAKLPDGVYYVDIPFRVYETGSFYCYKKRPDVTFDADDVVVDKVFEGHDEWERLLDVY